MDNISGSAANWNKDVLKKESEKTEDTILTIVPKNEITKEFTDEIDNMTESVNNIFLLLTDKYKIIPNKYLGDVLVNLRNVKQSINKFKTNINVSNNTEELQTGIIKEEIIDLEVKI